MIFPSKWEGLPVTLVEAQASNTPCFISESVTQEANLGLCTYLSLDRDAKEWAIDINNYINNSSYNNKINVEQLNKFNIHEVAKEIKKIYMTNKGTYCISEEGLS